MKPVKDYENIWSLVNVPISDNRCGDCYSVCQDICDLLPALARQCTNRVDELVDFLCDSIDLDFSMLLLRDTYVLAVFGLVDDGFELIASDFDPKYINRFNAIYGLVLEIDYKGNYNLLLTANH